MGIQFHRPDAAAVEAALSGHDCRPAGMVLLLAWRAGLTRDEIHALAWDSVDLAAGLLRLPDREIPLEGRAAEALERWKSRSGDISAYVAVSPKYRTHLAPSSVSALARSALDAVGQRQVRLIDLRYDYIRRQIAAGGWAHALRVAGAGLANYRNALAAALCPPETAPENEGGEREQAPPPADGEYRLWQLMQRGRGTAAGMALWMLRQMALRPEEIAALTWDDVDLDAGVLRTGGRETAMTQGVRRVLAEEKARRAAEDDPHVLLSPRSRAPMNVARLCALVREALIRGGLEGYTAAGVRQAALRERAENVLGAYVREHGFVTPRQASEALGTDRGAAWRSLRELTERGVLVCVGGRDYSAETTAPPERHPELLRAYLARAGAVSAGEAGELLGLPSRQAARVLKRLTAQGVLSAGERGVYTLP